MANLFNGLSEERLDEIIAAYFAGTFNTRNLPEDIYNATIKKVSTGVMEGFGGSIDDFADGSGEKELLQFFNQNVQRFSSAKTYQEANDLTNILFDEEGFKRSFSAFKADAKQITEIYNDNWLKTEFTTANRMGFSSRGWMDSVRDQADAPLLKYQTVGDERVRPEHVNLDNIIRPVNSSFWNTHYPPNGWRCRCIVQQLLEDEEPITPSGDLPPVDEIPPLFRMNPGKDKFIFDPKKHPYFKVAPKDQGFKDNNFGLPLKPSD